VNTSGPEASDRNLYQLASQTYEDISLAAVAMLCRGDPGVVDELVEAVVGGNAGALLLVGDAVFVTGSSELEDAMRQRVGNEWVGRYRRACDASSSRSLKPRPN
jgi:hypothetical protein